MTITFPVTNGQFSDLLHKTSVSFWLASNQESSGQASGAMIVADLGPRFWMADIGLINMSNDDARAAQALIEALDGGLNPFYLYDPRCAFPASDPTGSILGSSTVTNSFVAGDAKRMQFAGFPAHYVISVGDMFSFDYGGGAYTALHRVVAGDTADGAGNTGYIEFRPHLADPSLSTGRPMTWKKPSCKMMLMGDIEPGTAQLMMTTGMKLRCRQVP